jgi:hypothetical protein
MSVVDMGKEMVEEKASDDQRGQWQLQRPLVRETLATTVNMWNSDTLVVSRNLGTIR